MEGGAGGGGPTAHTSGSKRPRPQHCVAEGAPPHGLRHRDPHRPTREEGQRPRAPQQPPTAALPQSPHRTKEPSCARTARTRRRPCRGAQGRQGQDRRLRPHRASASAPGASAPGCVLSSLTLWPSRSGRQSSILSPIRLGCGQHLWQIWAAGTWLGRMDSPAAPARGPGPPAALRPPADHLSTPPCHRHHAQCQHRGHWEEQQTP